MASVSIYLPDDLHARIKDRYPKISEAVQQLFEKDLEQIENPDGPTDLAFQLRMLAHRVERMAKS